MCGTSTRICTAASRTLTSTGCSRTGRSSQPDARRCSNQGADRNSAPLSAGVGDYVYRPGSPEVATLRLTSGPASTRGPTGSAHGCIASTRTFELRSSSAIVPSSSCTVTWLRRCAVRGSAASARSGGYSFRSGPRHCGQAVESGQLVWVAYRVDARDPALFDGDADRGVEAPADLDARRW